MFSQTTLEGTIRDSIGNVCPLLNVIVSSVENPNIAIAFCTSNDEGSYLLKFNSNNDSIRLQITGLNIVPKSKIVKNISSRHDFTVREQVWEIKSVTVNADKLYSYGDTVNYSVDSYAAENDISIGEVLKKMPGITVAPSGQISYMGTPIKKFYIEGLDLLKSRYGLATNNISPKDIATVQVFENHQDIEALRDLRYEDRASINLKLKQGVKGVFQLLGTAGAGFDKRLLWDNGLTGMYFGRTHQHFSTYKGNNRGVDLAAELRSFSDDDYDYTLQATSIRLPSPPAISKNKYYFNNSNSGTLNNLFKAKNGDEFGVNIIFLNDYERRNSIAKTVYMLPDGNMKIIDETLSSGMNTNRLSGEISYRKNEKKLYVNETLLFSGERNGGHGTVNTETDVHQQTDIQTVGIRNKLHFIKRTDDAKGFELYSTINVEEKPQNLYVTPYLFANTLGGNHNGMHQHLKTANINTRNSAS
ncbi:MAG: TonB-dependent receptor, partial [Bacteroidales bacterium]|nr:TonB-dependent receptor [Bacteroidales bacterium]